MWLENRTPPQPYKRQGPGGSGESWKENSLSILGLASYPIKMKARDPRFLQWTYLHLACDFLIDESVSQ